MERIDLDKEPFECPHCEDTQPHIHIGEGAGDPGECNSVAIGINTHGEIKHAGD